MGANAAAINFPDAAESDFKGIVDIVEQKYITYTDDQGMEMVKSEVPEHLKERLQKYRHTLIEHLANVDDAMAEKYLEEKEITLPELKAAIRRVVLKSTFLPVLGGTSLRNRGVQLVLDAICDYLPSPLDLPPVKGTDPATQAEITRAPDPKAPFSAIVFKLATDPYVGKLFYTRIYSGTLESGSTVYNSSQKQREKIAKIVLMHANRQEIVPRASVGDIVGLVGLKESKTGETLCDPDQKIILERMRIPEPVVSMSIEPKTKADQDKLGLTLRKFLDEDPSLRVNYDQETAQTVISGMGELHLEIIIDRMKREFNLDANVGRPEVAYKETITRKATDIVGKYISQTGGKGQYGHVVIDIEPSEEKGKGVIFIDKIRGGAIPREFITPIEKGIRSGALSGVLAGYPAIDFTVTLVDGSYHDVDSNEMAFQVAARIALKEGLQKAKSVLLEPIMDIEVTCPEEFMGSVIGDLNTRRAKIVQLGNIAHLKTTRCEVPLAEMFNYANALRSLTQGRATFTMEPAFYAQVPQYVTDKVIGAREESSGKKTR